MCPTGTSKTTPNLSEKDVSLTPEPFYLSDDTDSSGDRGSEEAREE